MLLSFRVGNHRSFRAEQELLMLPAYDKGRDATPVAAIYGANASGKSNLLDALRYMREAVLESFVEWPPLRGIPRHPFKLAGEMGNAESRFGVDLLIGGEKYVYGFALDDRRIGEEWLYHYPHGRRRVLFERDGQEFRFGDSLRGPRGTVREVTRRNCLFLSAAAQHGLDQLLPVYRWFDQSLRFVLTDGERDDQRQSIEMLATRSADTRRLVELLRAADLGITDITLEDADALDLTANVVELLKEDDVASALTAAQHELFGSYHVQPETRSWLAADTWKAARSRIRGKKPRITLQHRTGDEFVGLDLSEESRGTRTWFGFLGTVIGTLNDGTVLVVDELDTSLHPLLVREFVRLFQREATNPHGAQLVFTTHDSALLGRQHGEELLRRDEIWFTEKDRAGASVLYPLTDFQPRAGLNWERRYLGGAVGAVPFLDTEEFAGQHGGQGQ